MTQMAMVLFQVFFVIPVAYSQPLNLMVGLFSVWSWGNFCLTAALFYSSMDYLIGLQQKLQFTNIENLKLLDGMHEGLMIFKNSKKHDETRQVMFCNRSASRLANTFLGDWTKNSPPE